MIRKFVPVIAALALVLVVGTVAYAADTPATAPYGQGQCTNFVDADGDGVCDNLGQNVPPATAPGTSTEPGSTEPGRVRPAWEQGKVVTAPLSMTTATACATISAQNVPPRDGTGSQSGKTSGQRSGRP